MVLLVSTSINKSSSNNILSNIIILNNKWTGINVDGKEELNNNNLFQNIAMVDNSYWISIGNKANNTSFKNILISNLTQTIGSVIRSSPDISNNVTNSSIIDSVFYNNTPPRTFDWNINFSYMNSFGNKVNYNI